MLRVVQLAAVVLLVALVFTPAPAQAGLQHVLRFFGEFWGDGYHSQGDYWNQPPRHAAPMPAYRPYYPAIPTAVPQPIPVQEEAVPKPAASSAQIITGVRGH